MKTKKSSTIPATNTASEKISVKISLPELSHLSKINGFYQKVEKKCREFCARSLSAQYPNQNLHYSIRYAYEQNGDLIVIRLYTSLSNRQTMRLLFATEQTHVWREHDQLLIKVRCKQSNTKNRTA